MTFSLPSSSSSSSSSSLLKFPNVKNMYPQLFLTFNIVLGGGGGNCNGVLKYSSAFRRNTQIIDNYEFCMTVPRNFVQDCSYTHLTFHSIHSNTVCKYGHGTCSIRRMYTTDTCILRCSLCRMSGRIMAAFQGIQIYNTYNVQSWRISPDA